MKIHNQLRKLIQIRWLPFVFGILVVLFSLLPAIILGEDGYVGVQDQMDGEVLVYIINARNFGASSFPEFMNGMDATSLTPPSYGSVLFYMLMSPIAAFLTNYVFVALLAFIGMFLLLDSFLENKWLSAVVALLFSQLPFYSVYGLSVMGQPLLFYACGRLWKNKKPLVSFVITALFALFSSLVLIGFADVLLLLCFAFLLQLRKHPNARNAWIQAAILLGIYLLPNIPLLLQILVPSDVISHKVELVATAQDTLSSYKTLFREGAYHAASLHGDLVDVAIVCVLASLAFYSSWSKKEKSRVWALASLLTVASAIAVFYAFWHSTPVVALRNRLGGVFVSFQVDRLYWLYPVIWFLILGLVFWLLLQITKYSHIQAITAWLCICVIAFNLGNTLYENSVFAQNIKALKGSQNYVSWDDFYSPELFQEIEDYIGLEQEEYRVASLALYPSVPLYNGFYCIDGYSNNYNVQYKHQFRTIISKELEKSDAMRIYFDEWGNRCYLLSGEVGQVYYTKYSERILKNVELNPDGLKQLGCNYIFSGLQIENPAVSGLEFEKFFEHEDSPYRIWLYRVV